MQLVSDSTQIGCGWCSVWQGKFPRHHRPTDTSSLDCWDKEGWFRKDSCCRGEVTTICSLGQKFRITRSGCVLSSICMQFLWVCASCGHKFLLFANKNWGLLLLAWPICLQASDRHRWRAFLSSSRQQSIPFSRTAPYCHVSSTDCCGKQQMSILDQTSLSTTNNHERTDEIYLHSDVWCEH